MLGWWVLIFKQDAIAFHDNDTFPFGIKGVFESLSQRVVSGYDSLFNSVEVKVDYIDLEESNDEIFARSLTLIAQVDSGEGIIGIDFPTFRMSRKG